MCYDNNTGILFIIIPGVIISIYEILINAYAKNQLFKNYIL